MNQSLTPQDKAINHFIPLFFYHIYRKDNQIYGYLLDWKPPSQARRDFVAVYQFNGRTANYWVATDDLSILRADALSFAVRVHENKCRILHVDLSQIGRFPKENK